MQITTFDYFELVDRECRAFLIEPNDLIELSFDVAKCLSQRDIVIVTDSSVNFVQFFINYSKIMLEEYFDMDKCEKKLFIILSEEDLKDLKKRIESP